MNTRPRGRRPTPVTECGRCGAAARWAVRTPGPVSRLLHSCDDHLSETITSVTVTSIHMDVWRFQ